MKFNYDNIPEILKWNKNWCLSGPDEKGRYKAPYSFNQKNIFRIKSNETTYLKDFETVIDACNFHVPCGIGYIINDNSLYTCIDLDVHNKDTKPDNPELWSTPEQLERFQKIITTFDSYTERSVSGLGYHIWVKGKLKTNSVRDGVEIYTHNHFILCTGNVYLDREIKECQDILEILESEILQDSSSEEIKKIALVEIEESETDDSIFERAREANNADKFITLCNGNWEAYPSQSEADLALMSIFTFYSKSNVQCRRLFRMTKLGERIKANKNDIHLNRILVVIRSRQETEEKVDVFAAEQSAALIARLISNIELQDLSQVNQQLNNSLIPIKSIIPPEDLPIPIPVLFNSDLFSIENRIQENIHPWPPGLVGEIARYIFNSSPRPVREVSIVSALGLMAGVCGKAFTIHQSGLNLYIVLVARSAIGKEAMHSGISNIMSAISNGFPQGMRFVDFTDYASGPALTKAIVLNQSFVNVSGEWGRKLRRLAMDDGKDGPMQQLRTVMTNIYQKSGPGSIVGGIGYSDKEKNIASVSGIAYSMIGETTPQTFYDALTEQMMADGFMSRFTIIEYDGKRPEANPNPIIKIEIPLLEAIHCLMKRAFDLNTNSKNQEVILNNEAKMILSSFDKECDIQVNKTDDEGWRQMWNRAHLKAYRISALLAVGDNVVLPVIVKQHAEWAIDLIRRDINLMHRRIDSGEVGTTDSSRERKLLDIMKKYLINTLAPGYDISIKMQTAGVIPRKYLQINTQRVTSFSSHRLGQNAALDYAIKSLIDSGYITELSKEKAITTYDYNGRCFRILSLPK